ncbi:hypothetical protein CDG76_31360 [Nostoc sp. 'Peltigera membranacea cyanobiont' 210A]|uniref:DUF2281 domain-containing protein n=1 Tax=Nostoc sp. 'Peltigera membranacea cyanobiont' 210A TaxID=2014529 RepID=UPI000B955713|nr:DUF2281 domain-containing protein [Nostoc sp. 'Peltigera membranacea cyanobiont' 210A]OYD90227.1 hypothetical protein CDG76_31360 [Nostoc sp. 'Peltigera membranacea cyanobiont' 210A]
MTQAIDKEQMIIDEVKKLSPEKQQEVLNFIEFLHFKELQKQETLQDTEKEKQVSFLEAAKEFIGCIDGGPGDLATNKKYLEGFGR